MQKRATKIIWLLEEVLYPERFKEFNLFSSSERRLGEALITVSKCFHREKTTGIKGLSNLTKAGITRSYGQELQPGGSQWERSLGRCCDEPQGNKQRENGQICHFLFFQKKKKKKNPLQLYIIHGMCITHLLTQPTEGHVWLPHCLLVSVPISRAGVPPQPTTAPCS